MSQCQDRMYYEGNKTEHNNCILSCPSDVVRSLDF